MHSLDICTENIYKCFCVFGCCFRYGKWISVWSCLYMHQHSQTFFVVARQLWKIIFKRNSSFDRRLFNCINCVRKSGNCFLYAFISIDVRCDMWFLIVCFQTIPNRFKCHNILYTIRENALHPKAEQTAFLIYVYISIFLSVLQICRSYTSEDFLTHLH